MLYFCLTIVKITKRWGLRPQTSLPPVAEGFAPRTQPSTAGGFPQTLIGLRRLDTPPLDLHISPLSSMTNS